MICVPAHPHDDRRILRSLRGGSAASEPALSLTKDGNLLIGREWIFCPGINPDAKEIQTPLKRGFIVWEPPFREVWV